MTSKSAKKVVIINDIKSKNIEQAIFILRDNEVLECQGNIIDEANEIIQNYMAQVRGGQYRSIKPKRKWFKWKK